MSERIFVFERFSRKLAQPIFSGLVTISDRVGSYVYSQECPQIPLVEISPLPGFSKESLTDALRDFSDGCCTTPSAKFALSSLKLIADLETDLLSGSIQCSELSSRSLIPTTSHSGSLVVKHKIRADIDHYTEQLSHIRELLGKTNASCRVRLDFNCNPANLPVARVLDYLKPEQIDYLEDAAPSLEQMESLRDLPFSLAADDLLVEYLHSPEQIIKLPIDVAVIKPQRTGSYDLVEQIVAAATSSGKRVTLTSLLETEIGLVQCFLYALKLSTNYRIEPCGFLTLPIFTEQQDVFVRSKEGWQLSSDEKQRLIKARDILKRDSNYAALKST